MRLAAPALLAALALAPAPVRAGGERPRLGVLAAASGEPAAAIAFIAKAVDEAARQAGAETIPADEVARAVLAAKGDASTCGDKPACAAAVCAVLGADALLAASVKDTGKFWMVSVAVREARGGWIRVHGVEATGRTEPAARDAAVRLVTKLVGQFAQSPGVTPAPPATAGPPAPPVPATPTIAEVPSPLRSPDRGADGEPAQGSKASPPSLATRAPRPAPGVPTAPERSDAEPAPSSRRFWGTAIAGSGAALLAAGAAVGGYAWLESNGASAALARGDLGTFTAGRQSSRTLAWTAVGLGGGGAVMLAAGAWLRLGAGPSRVVLGLEPGALRVAVAF
jgi:hypothetical protein